MTKSNNLVSSESKSNSGDSASSLLALMALHELKADPARGQIVKGIYEGSGLVSYGGKSDGIVDADALRDKPLELGESAEFLVLGTSERDGLVRLSHVQASGWTELLSQKESGAVVAAQAERIALRGDRKPAGLVLSYCGVRGFISTRSLGVNTRSLESLVGTTVETRIAFVDPAKGRVVFDSSSLAEERRSRFLSGLNRGDSVTGVVVNKTDFGAFVEVQEGVQALLHRSQLEGSLEALSLGTEITASVINVDAAKQRLSLSTKGNRKEERDARMSAYLDRVSEGDLVSGVVSHLREYGAFVTVADGVQGLVHISDLKDLSLKEGESVDAVVISKRNNRLGLSVRRVIANRFAETLEVGQSLEGTVCGVTGYAAFVRLGDSILEGFLHNRFMSPEVCGKLQPGDKVKVKVTELTSDAERRVGLSMID